MNESERSRFESGVLYGVAAYGLWGLMPLYFRLTRHVPAGEILAQRIAWSFAFLLAICLLAGRGRDLLRAFTTRRIVLPLLVSTVLLALNWFVFVYAVVTNRVVQTSLGYFILPLVSVVLGLVVFAERLRTAQVWALASATVGVLVLFAVDVSVPWIPLTLALSFGVYGVVRKTVPVDGLVGLTVETVLMTPPAVVYAAYLSASGTALFGTGDTATDGVLVLSGLVTAVPLLCFGQSARRLPLSVLGFMQYIAPSISFVLAVAFFGEQVTGAKWVASGLIWLALAVFSFDGVAAVRRTEPAPEPVAVAAE